jgi:hypothetical protein
MAPPHALQANGGLALASPRKEDPLTPVTPRELVTLLITGGGLWALLQFAGLKFWHAALVFAAGFYLATTAAGSQVSELAARILTAVGH